MKKAIKTIGAVIIVLLLAVIGFDIHVLRGHFLTPYIYRSTFAKFDGNFEYTITENVNGTWDLYLKNRDLAYYPIILYRTDVFFDLNDTIAFQYASRVKFVDNDTTIYDTGGSFDCGTDLAYAMIRPYESFKLKSMKIDDVIPSLRFYVNEMKEKIRDFKTHETLTCQLYLPIFSFGDEETRVYSNEIKLKMELLNGDLESYSKKRP